MSDGRVRPWFDVPAVLSVDVIRRAVSEVRRDSDNQLIIVEPARVVPFAGERPPVSCITYESVDECHCSSIIRITSSLEMGSQSSFFGAADQYSPSSSGSARETAYSTLRSDWSTRWRMT